MKELNDENFNEQIRNKKLILVDFYATWCGPCNMQAKVLAKLQSSRSLGFDIVKVNVDESPQLAMKYGIESIPTLIVLKNNEIVKRNVGYTEESEILKIMEEFK